MKNTFKVIISLLLFLSLFLLGCGGGGKKVKPIENIISFKNYNYNVDLNTYELPYGQVINNPYEVSFSQDKKYIIYTSINNYDEPEVYIYNKHKNAEKKLTNNIFIETNPVINNKGTYAYALSEYSTSTSKIYLNNKLLEGSVGLYKNLDINSKHLIYNFEDFNVNKHYIQWVNINDKVINAFEFSLGYIQKIQFFTDEKAVVQYYSLENMSMDVGIFDIQSQMFLPLKNTKEDELISDVNYGEGYTLSSVPLEAVNIKLLFNAYYNYYNFQFANPFANSNNFMGRLTWNQSYRLTNLVKLYKTTNNQNILKQIDYVIESLLDGINEKIGVNNKDSFKYSFSTKKYSMDKVTPISALASDAMVYVSIVDAINNIGGELQTKYSSIVNKYVSGLFDYYNDSFHEDIGMYTFQPSAKFSFDGVWVPFNQQNTFSTLMLEMYKLTSEEKYKDRAFILANTFKHQFAYTNNKLIWHYWPSIFYAGWNENDNISVNTPSRSKSEDNLYEDLAHAGINIIFIFKFQEMFPNEIFTSSDISLLRNTVDGFIYDNKFSRFMSGDTDYQDVDYRFIPTFGWSLLKHQTLNSFYVSLNPNFYPDFDQQAWDNELDPIDLNKLKNEDLEIQIEKFDLDSVLLNSQISTYDTSNVHSFFETKK